jgi:UDP-N-acetylglucosamine--N-acetylmuramyl-(pentapeptide) pyrophosphoryl-undecaprenol N-acetylglucosamine transferase
MRAVFSGGGTGGHLYPALAIIKYMQNKGILTEVKYTGGYGIEKNVVPKEGIDYLGFNIHGLKRPKKSPSNLKIILQYYIAAYKIKKLMKKFNPDFVFVTGGYASIPLSIAARKLGIPIFNQEQNVYVGFANRFINKFAFVTFTNFDRSIDYFSRKDNIVVCGNPVMRKRIDRKDALDKFLLDDKITIGIFGGSGGSEKINDSIKEIYDDDDNYNYIHVTGKRDYDRFRNINKYNVRILDYCNDMDSFYSACDLVISRAGAMTISELMSLKIPAILIPHPFAAENHQFYNAQYLQNKGLALILDDKKLNPNTLKDYINKTVSGITKIREKYDKIKTKNSLETITNKILEVLNERKNN